MVAADSYHPLPMKNAFNAIISANSQLWGDGSCFLVHSNCFVTLWVWVWWQTRSDLMSVLCNCPRDAGCVPKMRVQCSHFSESLMICDKNKLNISLKETRLWKSTRHFLLERMCMDLLANLLSFGRSRGAVWCLPQTISWSVTVMQWTVYSSYLKFELRIPSDGFVAQTGSLPGVLSISHSEFLAKILKLDVGGGCDPSKCIRECAFPLIPSHVFFIFDWVLKLMIEVIFLITLLYRFWTMFSNCSSLHYFWYTVAGLQGSLDHVLIGFLKMNCYYFLKI